MGELLRHLLHTLDGPIPTTVGFVIVAVRYTLLTVGATAAVAVLTVVQIFWRATLGRFFRWLANVSILTKHPFGRAAEVDTAVEYYIAAGIAKTERSLVYALNQLVDTFAILIAVPVLIAQGLAELTQWTAGKLHGVATRKEVHNTRVTIKKDVTVVKGVTKAQLVTLQKKVKVLQTRVALATRTAPTRVFQPSPRLKRVETKVKTLDKRTSRLERLKLAPVAIVAVALASKKLGLQWLNCPSVKKVGRRTCGLDDDMLEALFAATVLLIGAQSLDKLARELDPPTGVVMDSMGLLVTEVRDAFALIPR